MGTIVGFTQPKAYQGGCLSIGNFDGVHRGHQKILSELVRQARSMGVPSVVMTFDPHPVSLLAPGQLPPPLTTLEFKSELIERMGVDVVLVVPTTAELLGLTAAEFFEQVLVREIQFRGIIEGTNFCFGRGRQGTVSTLQNLCARQGSECRIVEPLYVSDVTVSSSTIRKLLQVGNVEDAYKMLGRPHRASGIVATGAQRGRTIGFPTANVEQVETLLPAHGVYAARCRVAGSTHLAAVNLGPNPTFGVHASKLEAHLLGFDGELYGSRIDVDFIGRLRDVSKFASVEQLQAQLREDVERVRGMLGVPIANE